MTIVCTDITDNFLSYIKNHQLSPLFLLGDALFVLQQLPSNSIDFCMTSPPYWGQREYSNGGLGYEQYEETKFETKIIPSHLA